VSGFDRETLRALLVQARIGKLKDTGNGFAGLCPFHDNKRTPAWGMNLEGLWRCFNAECEGYEGGNLTAFLVRVLGMNLRDAAEFQPSRAVTEEMVHRRLPAYDDRQKGLEGVVEYVPEAKLARYRKCPNYMLSRGYPAWFLREYDIGYDAEAAWPGKRIVEAVTFPVRDHVTGYLLGFTRRTVQPDVDPAYSHELPKNRTLYLLHKLATSGPVLLTEGPCDALTARLRAMEGDGDPAVLETLANAVATMGGGFSEEHAVMLSALARPVVLAFDNDKAGVAARESAISLLHEAGVAQIQVLRYPRKDLGMLEDSDMLDLQLIPAHRRFAR
jgi:DNA primase